MFRVARKLVAKGSNPFFKECAASCNVQKMIKSCRTTLYRISVVARILKALYDTIQSMIASVSNK